MSHTLEEAKPAGTSQVVKLIVFLLAGVALAVALHAVNVLVVVLAIVAMVMLHELGHFVAAKLGGMKVTEYFFGFGPRLWSMKKGETEYGVKAIPAGGYVRIPGMTMMEDVAAEDEPRSYRQASFPRRIAVAVAGSTVHMIIALVMCFFLLVLSGTFVSTRPYVVGMLRFSGRATPAMRAGLRDGDMFVSLDGHKVTGDGVLENVIGSSAGKNVTAVVSRDGRLHHLVLRPVNDTSVTEIIDGQHIRPTGAPRGVIGVELQQGRVQKVGALDAFPRAGALFGSLVTASFTGIGEVVSVHGLSSFFHSVFTSSSVASTGSTASGGHASGGGSSSSAQPTSILGFVEIGSQAASNNVPELVDLLAYLNVFIGIINLFPLLPFDGGHVAIAVYERLRSRRGRRYHADVMKMLPFAYVFLAFFVLLGLGALYSNIVHPIHLPGS
jgi:membrane-associated protease RseP (regulator of RpoE activity)